MLVHHKVTQWSNKIQQHIKICSHVLCYYQITNNKCKGWAGVTNWLATSRLDGGLRNGGKSIFVHYRLCIAECLLAWVICWTSTAWSIIEGKKDVVFKMLSWCGSTANRITHITPSIWSFFLTWQHNTSTTWRQSRTSPCTRYKKWNVLCSAKRFKTGTMNSASNVPTVKYFYAYTKVPHC